MDKKDIKIQLPYERCTGCFSCQNICPVNAISLPEDKIGFIHAKIDSNICIKCRLCEKTCPVNNLTPKHTANFPIALKAKDQRKNIDSTSSGVLSILAGYILNKNGIVYGCKQECYSNIHHARIEKEVDLAYIKGSKYVQSNINFILKDLRKDLIEGKEVLFIGTPCQVAGVINFLKKPFSNLTTAEILCHGVPPSKMLNEEIDYIIRKKNITNKKLQVIFRWKNPKTLKLVTGFKLIYREPNGVQRIVLEQHDNPYSVAFHRSYSLRTSCYQCQYAGNSRVADLTAGDFWGIGKIFSSKWKDDDGISLLLTNTEKGKFIYENYLKQFFDEEYHTFDEASLWNHSLLHPVKEPIERKIFLETYTKNNLHKSLLKADKKYRKSHNFIYKILHRNTILYKSINLIFSLIKK